MYWTFLILAGCFEVCGVINLKLTEGFKKLKPTIFFFFGGSASYFYPFPLSKSPLASATAFGQGLVQQEACS